MSGVAPAGTALLGTLLLAPLVRVVLHRFELIDHPVGRSSHTVPTLRGGGLAAAVAGTGVLLLWPGSGPAVAAAVAGYALLGLAEDAVGVPIRPRLLLQVLCGAAAAAAVAAPPAFGGTGRVLATLLIAVWIVGYTNAFNFMDGINGISVAQALVAGTTFAVLGATNDQPTLLVGGAVAGGAALGFAPWNIPRARMFLGDVGSYFFGALLAVVAALGVANGLPPEAMLAPLALYVADTSVTLLRRVCAREPWWTPHRTHAYQRLVANGWSHLATSSLVAGLVAVMAALGSVSLSGCAGCRAGADVAILVLLVGYLVLPNVVHRRRQAAHAAAPRP